MNRKLIEFANRVSQDTLQRILHRMSEGILFVDPEGKVVFCNEPGRVLRRGLSGRDPGGDILACHTPASRVKVMEIIHDLSLHPEKRHVEIVEVAGASYEFVYSGVFDIDGSHLGTLAVSRDVTDRVSYERRLNELAAVDSLTGLYNRRFFMEKLGDEITRAERQHHPLALALFDVNKFKEINDRLGHLEGDRVLTEVARVTESSIRAGVDTLCRYGGDEFTVILSETSLDVASKVIRRVAKNIASSVQPNVTISAGLTVLQLGVDLETLIRQADFAMYEAKKDHLQLKVFDG